MRLFAFGIFFAIGNLLELARLDQLISSHQIDSLGAQPIAYIFCGIAMVSGVSLSLAHIDHLLDALFRPVLKSLRHIAGAGSIEYKPDVD